MNDFHLSIVSSFVMFWKVVIVNVFITDRTFDFLTVGPFSIHFPMCFCSENANY